MEYLTLNSLNYISLCCSFFFFLFRFNSSWPEYIIWFLRDGTTIYCSFIISTVLHNTRHIVVKMCVKITQSCPTLCNRMDYTVHGILQAWILEWVAFPFSRGSSQPRSPSLQEDSLPAEPQGKPRNTGVGSRFLLQQIFPPNPGIKPGSPSLQADSLPNELWGEPGHILSFQ